MLERELKANLILLSRELAFKIGKRRKIRKYKFYIEFLNRFPLQYQRDDKIILSYKKFLKFIRKENVCSPWKLNKRNSKFIKLKKRKND